VGNLCSVCLGLDVIAIVGGLSPNEADRYLKNMTHARSQEEMLSLGKELRDRARERGMDNRSFGKLWKQIHGFSRYGFCHGHSVAFAEHAQGTAWLSKHHPAVFFAAVLSVEPCGFWPVATIVEEVRRRGIGVLGPCLNRSEATLWEPEEGKVSIRSSLAFVKSISPEIAEAIVQERTTNGKFSDLSTTCQRLSFVPRECLEWLVISGAFETLHPNRRLAIWSLPALHRAPDKYTKTRGQVSLEISCLPTLPPNLPAFTQAEKEHHEWQALGFSLSGHPMRHHRQELTTRGILTCANLQTCKNGETVTLAGLSLHPHRPPVPSGEIVVFLTLEDETGIAQVTVPPDVYETYGAILLSEKILIIEGNVAQRGGGNILLATRIERCQLRLQVALR
jgi:error-prone DNA polymerase